ncbi:MAG: hypothetical protein QM688_01655 [Sphingomonas bacterium]
MSRIRSSHPKRWPISPFVAGAAVLFFPFVAAGASGEDQAAGLIAAERAFAADAGRIGITPAFRAHVAPDAILIRPDPAPALPVLAKEVDTPGLRLEWQPAIAAIARSGDLGFTTGPYRLTQKDKALYGRFLTIWERGADGKWRWYIDHGLPPVSDVPQELAPVAVTVLRQGLPARGRPMPGAADADTALNAAIVARGTGAVVEHLAADGHLLRLDRGMVRTDQGIPVSGAETLGIRASTAGDLAASYGRLSLTDGGQAHYYVRIWRRDRAGWRLLIDQIN